MTGIHTIHEVSHEFSVAIDSSDGQSVFTQPQAISAPTPERDATAAPSNGHASRRSLSRDLSDGGHSGRSDGPAGLANGQSVSARSNEYLPMSPSLSTLAPPPPNASSLPNSPPKVARSSARRSHTMPRELTPAEREQEIADRKMELIEAVKRARVVFWVDFLAYLVYLAIFLAATLGPFTNSSRDSYQLVDSVTTYLATLTTPHQSKAFSSIGTVDDFWAFVRLPLNYTLYGVNPYAETDSPLQVIPLASHKPGWMLNSKFVGTVRLRQQRVRATDGGNCGTLADICYTSNLNGDTQDTDDFAWPVFESGADPPLDYPPPPPPPQPAPLAPNTTGRRLTSQAAHAAEQRSHKPGGGFGGSSGVRADAWSRRRRLLAEGIELLRARQRSSSPGPQEAAGEADAWPPTRGGAAAAAAATRSLADAGYNETTLKGQLAAAGLLSAFVYRSPGELSQAAVVVAQYNTRVYDGGGYALDFNLTSCDNFTFMYNTLRQLEWVDRATRVVILEFSLYAPASNLVCAVRMVVQFHPSGYAEPSIVKEAFRIDFYAGWAKSGRIALDLFLVVCVVCFVVADIYSAFTKSHATGHSAWYGRPFFWAAILTLCAMIVIVGVRINNLVKLHKLDVGSVADGSQFFPVHGTAFWMGLERVSLALLSFLVFFRSFKYTLQIPVVGTIGRTINRAIPQITIFLVMSTVIFFGLAQSFYLGFYLQSFGFQTLGQSVMSLVRFTSGDLDYLSLWDANTILAPLLYCVLLVVLAFVWSNILIAIVLHAYDAELAAENYFVFDPDFPDMDIILARKGRHPELDKSAMEGSDGVKLVPSTYNRFILSSLAHFDERKLYTMSMAEVIDLDVFDTPQYGNADASKIYLRIGFLKGRRAIVEPQAIYFPKDQFVSAERAADWWKRHKHHLRVGDAVIRSARRGVGIFASQVKAGCAKAARSARSLVRKKPSGELSGGDQAPANKQGADDTRQDVAVSPITSSGRHSSTLSQVNLIENEHRTSSYTLA